MRQISLMAYNIRWCKESDKCLDRIADLIKAEKSDIVFLPAIYYECAQCPVKNQVTYLASKTGLHSYAFAENYNWGFPFYRNRSGNAILSRYPLRALFSQPLSGSRFDPRSRRRTLWAEVEINGRDILVGSVHNSASDQDINLLQVGEILEYTGGLPALLGGDFNATPESRSMQAIRSSGHFIGDFDGPNTYPTSKPARRLDYILAPSNWLPLEHKVLEFDASAHLPVVSSFVIPRRDAAP